MRGLLGRLTLRLGRPGPGLPLQLGLELFHPRLLGLKLGVRLREPLLLRLERGLRLVPRLQSISESVLLLAKQPELLVLLRRLLLEGCRAIGFGLQMLLRLLRLGEPLLQRLHLAGQSVPLMHHGIQAHIRSLPGVPLAIGGLGRRGFRHG